jgi:hypothetical protein
MDNIFQNAAQKLGTYRIKNQRWRLNRPRRRSWPRRLPWHTSRGQRRQGSEGRSCVYDTRKLKIQTQFNSGSWFYYWKKHEYPFTVSPFPCKSKVKFFLCWSKHAMNMYWWSGSIAPRILDLDSRWRWSASLLGRSTPRERAPGTHWIGAWVEPRAVLDAVVKRKIPSPRRESNLRTPIVQPIA